MSSSGRSCSCVPLPLGNVARMLRKFCVNARPAIRVSRSTIRNKENVAAGAFYLFRCCTNFAIHIPGQGMTSAQTCGLTAYTWESLCQSAGREFRWGENASVRSHEPAMTGYVMAMREEGAACYWELGDSSCSMSSRWRSWMISASVGRASITPNLVQTRAPAAEANLTASRKSYLTAQ